MEAIFQKTDVPEVVMRERGAATCPSSELRQPWETNLVDVKMKILTDNSTLDKNQR